VEASCSFKSGVLRKKKLTAWFGDSRFGDFLRLSTSCTLLVGVLQLLEQFFSRKGRSIAMGPHKDRKGKLVEQSGAAAIAILEALEKSSSVFPPLQSVVGGTLHITKLVRVRTDSRHTHKH
jgi:hypothetical protein